MSISPIFYEQLFRTKVFCASFKYLQFGFVIFWQKDFGTKTAHIMLVKLTPGLLACGSVFVAGLLRVKGKYIHHLQYELDLQLTCLPGLLGRCFILVVGLPKETRQVKPKVLNS